MSLKEQTVQEIASQLLEAEKSCTPIDPITARYPEMTYDEAYAVQLKTIEAKVKAGAVVVGRKIGLTSKAMQELIGIDEPDFGIIVDSKVFSEGEVIRADSMMVPRIEAEIGFLLKRDLRGPGVTVVDVLAATEGVMPLLEVKDTRIKNLKPTIMDAIADNATSGIVILGGKLTSLTPDIDLRLIGMIFERNGEIMGTAAGAAALGNPAEPVAWLANKLARYGITLGKGEFVMSGGLTTALEVKPGSCFKATFDRLGSVSARFI
ncbi:MAG: 2-keto-4-pentenoate hydratase [Deltaproteobacteria bacterium]|nr:2-keto-4-pentenoate hydratase [Deltaproteobacteria bacterium]